MNRANRNVCLQGLHWTDLCKRSNKYAVVPSTIDFLQEPERTMGHRIYEGRFPMTDEMIKQQPYRVRKVWEAAKINWTGDIAHMTPQQAVLAGLAAEFPKE